MVNLKKYHILKKKVWYSKLIVKILPTTIADWQCYMWCIEMPALTSFREFKSSFLIFSHWHQSWIWTQWMLHNAWCCIVLFDLRLCHTWLCKVVYYLFLLFVYSRTKQVNCRKQITLMHSSGMVLLISQFPSLPSRWLKMPNVKCL